MRRVNENADEAIQQLVDDGLLTERQATAFVLREIELTPRPAVAEHMDISANTLDNTIRAAKDKIEAAEATIATIERIRSPVLPEECAECGVTLGGRWSEVDGEAVCLECAGINPDDVEL